MKKFYIVEMATGDASDIVWSNLFITDNKEKAYAYVAKANSLFQRFTEYYKSMTADLESENWMHYFERMNMCNASFYVNEIYFR